MTRRRWLAGLGLVVLVAAVAGIAGSATSHRRVGPVQTVSSPTAALPAGAPIHVALLVMENEEYGDIIGSPQTPYINRLATNGALATEMYAVSHPSLPNYLAMTMGSTFQISSDCTDCTVHAQGLADELAVAHVSWRAYEEGLPRPCFTGAGAGDYAKKHDPFAYDTNVTRDPAQCDRIVPLNRLSADERAHTLPAFSFITPNLCDDMHDCAPATGDHFLARLVPSLLRALGPRGLLILSWDEGTTDDGCCRLASGGHVATILAGGAVRAGARMRTPVDGYSILQTVEDLLGVERLRGAACPCTPSLAPLLGRPAGALRSG
jgi:hypothetical protein